MNNKTDVWHQVKETTPATSSDPDLTTCIIFAFRYALKRKTYAGSLVQDVVKKHRQMFALGDLFQMKREIEEQGLVGSDLWFRFHEWLEVEINYHRGDSKKPSNNSDLPLGK